ncbi:hypothetical protein BaRGS_00013423 [Batillaria attramentaria]|uniref:Uncharacterized protein n=1 Tax=Batillaria attramentaria TaxID=370345 RepID=A0ABD0L7J2_9CAEN
MTSPIGRPSGLTAWSPGNQTHQIVIAGSPGPPSRSRDDATDQSVEEVLLPRKSRLSVTPVDSVSVAPADFLPDTSRLTLTPVDRSPPQPGHRSETGDLGIKPLTRHQRQRARLAVILNTPRSLILPTTHRSPRTVVGDKMGFIASNEKCSVRALGI